MFKVICQVIIRIDYIFLYLVYRIFNNVKNENVVFLSNSHTELTGNFLCIYEEIKDDYNVEKFLGRESLKNKKDFCRSLAQAKYILLDDYYPVIYAIPLRKETKLIQVWHALGAFKTIGYRRKDNDGSLSLTHRNYTDAIVSSKYIVKDYADAFKMNQKNVHSIGIPRSDIFFEEQYAQQMRCKYLHLYPQLKGKKIVLFAPTFRGANVHKGYYDFDKINFNSLSRELGEDYFVIIKLHPFIKNKITEELDQNRFLDLTSENNINDLLFITDVLITDYSSVIFEAALLNIPTVFFVYDLNSYMEERDFFYPLEEYMYGTKVFKDEMLPNAIIHARNQKDKMEKFKEKFVSSCDGKSTKRFVEVLLKEN